ncbi:MAG: GNAT family N-acetyltransferase [Deltaproteobacteria bacterium]|nr:GNAT family N-acetyltransferase [Deltaproteobacteria bacterium]
MRDYRIRRAAVGDAAGIGWHRAAMFRDMGWIDEDELEGLTATCRAAMAVALASGEYLGWVVERDGGLVAGGGVLVRPLLPGPGHPDGGREAYVLNVYVEPAHRRHGLARRLMEEILAWSRTSGIRRVSLHASDAGRPLYLALGFTPTNELRREAMSDER